MRTLLGEVGLELVDDGGGAHKGERVVVHADVDPEFEVQPVLGRDCRQVGGLAPDVQVPPVQHIPVTISYVGDYLELFGAAHTHRIQVGFCSVYSI